MLLQSDCMVSIFQKYFIHMLLLTIIGLIIVLVYLLVTTPAYYNPSDDNEPAFPIDNSWYSPHVKQELADRLNDSWYFGEHKTILNTSTIKLVNVTYYDVDKLQFFVFYQFNTTDGRTHTVIVNNEFLILLSEKYAGGFFDIVQIDDEMSPP